MSDFSYCVVSSILHDRAAVDAIFERYRAVLQEAQGRRIEMTEQSDSTKAAPTAGLAAGTGKSSSYDEAQETPTFFFVLTGGTEGIVKKILVSEHILDQGKPVLLIAHPGHNSLPAALEILAWVRQQGGKGEVVFLQSPSDIQAQERIKMLAQAYSARNALARTRIGAVGNPSDWLIASSQAAEKVQTSWGPEIVFVPIATLEQKMGKQRKAQTGEVSRDVQDVQDKGRVQTFMSGATSIREASTSDMDNSNSIYEGLREIAKESGLDALTIRCFDLVTANGATGCYALSQLADEGIDAGCEGDIPSILALHAMRLLTGKPAWMANPASVKLGLESKRGVADEVADEVADKTDGSLVLAHCTVPRSLIQSYSLRSHFESGLGLAIAGTFEKTPVTLLRIGGDDLRQAWVAEGVLVASPHEEDLCRTQAVVQMENADLKALLERPLGNHIVMAPGSWKNYVVSLMNFLGIKQSV